MPKSLAYLYPSYVHLGEIEKNSFSALPVKR